MLSHTGKVELDAVLASKHIKKSRIWGWETGEGISEAKEMNGIKSKEGWESLAA